MNKIYIYIISVFVCVIILIFVLVFLFKSYSSVKDISSDSSISIDDTENLDINYIKSEEFKNKLLTNQIDIDSVAARGSSFAGPVTADPIGPSAVQLKKDNELTPKELAEKYTYPELVSKFGDAKLKTMYTEIEINNFKEIPNKHSFPKTKFQIKYFNIDNSNNLCLDDRGTTIPGQYKMNFATCNATSQNQQFAYEPYRKYLISANKNLCLDNGDENVNYSPNTKTGNMSYFSLQNCNPNTFRQRFTYDGVQKNLKNADRLEWVMSNPGFNDQTSKNVAVNKEYSDFMSNKQKVVFVPI